MEEFVEIRNTLFKLSPYRIGGGKGLHFEDFTFKDFTEVDWGEFQSEIKEIRIKRSKIESLTGIQKLDNLKELKFLDSHIDNISDVRQSNSLERLEFRRVNIYKEFSFDYGLPNLISITFEKVPLHAMTFLGRQKKLVGLTLKLAFIKQMSNLEQLESLGYLHLEGNPLTKIEGLELQRNLRTVILKKNKIISLEGLKGILENNEKLGKVNLLGNPIMKPLEIKGYVSWKSDYDYYYPRNLSKDIKISIPSIKKKKEDQKPSEEATNCKYCKQEIPPHRDFFYKHRETAVLIFEVYNRKIRPAEEKYKGRKLRYQIRRKMLPYLELAYLRGPICKQCSARFLLEAENVLSKIITKGFIDELENSHASVQNNYDKLYKKWLELAKS